MVVNFMACFSKEFWKEFCKEFARGCGRRNQALEIRPGPELGRVLEELREASFAGEIHTREEALQLASRLHERGQ